MSPRPKITKVDLSQFAEQEINLIQACDGIWDVASSAEIALLAVRDPYQLELPAERIVRTAINLGSQDNCSALVARLF